MYIRKRTLLKCMLNDVIIVKFKLKNTQNKISSLSFPFQGSIKNSIFYLLTNPLFLFLKLCQFYFSKSPCFCFSMLFAVNFLSFKAISVIS